MIFSALSNKVMFIGCFVVDLGNNIEKYCCNAFSLDKDNNKNKIKS